ncbi:vicilin Cor a 11.0101-like isoform X2 [Rhodamnia argentea]|uniref:Vicilin Cor a 11.0101-like isoform X2 n=1 Tax=Rhodamnia argentea TaxID=178133 RepID=A0ABM3HW55_9MYRT|nr:vicilin Cor a 11.0101-like isoform X2 [Rhodamnia argentea]
MALKASLAALSLLSLSLVLAVASAKQDPELKQCRHQCKVQQQFTEEQKRQCEQRCDDYYRQKQEREREEGREGGGQRSVEDDRKKLKECQQQCERREQKGRSREQCQQRCVEAYGRKEEDQPGKRRGKEEEEEKEKRGRKWVSERYEEEEEEEEEEQEREGREESDNPYVFETEHFKTQFETEHGRDLVLPEFGKRSKFLRGVENFRLGLLETDPQTFVVPSHRDADALLFIVKGRGTITLVRENKRHSINVEEGDIVKVEAGTPVYMINRDRNQKLVVAKLIKPVNLPGHFEKFYGAGGQNPESFYTAFSWEVLEAALKTDRNKLERLFGQQQQGAIVKASREQIEALSGREEGGRWPFGSSRSFNLFDKRPFQANRHGQLYIADREDLRELEDMDVMISFANITKGSMIGPYYNSRATKISFVTEGEGYLEMACPHLSPSQRRGGRSSGRQHHRGGGGGQTQGFQKVRARLRRGSAFIAPVGHPVAAIASRNSNLQIVCFEVNAENNVKYPLAGRRNIINLMEREAKELAFNFPSRDVERIFRSQEEDFFFAGPEEWREGERGYADE